MKLIFKPHDYQQKAIDFILTHNKAALFLDMGLGKTVISLTAVQSLLQCGKAKKVLVIAPKSVAESTWTQEADKWAHLDGLTVVAAVGDAKKRTKALSTPADIYIISRDNVCWLTENYEWDYDTLIIDELSSFKNPQAKRFKALKKVRPKIKRVIGLTGTPSANGLMDLWAEMYLIDGGKRLCRTITGYRCRWFRPGASNGHVVYNWIPQPKAQEEIQNAISDICLSMSAADYLTLPKCIYNTVCVNLTPTEKKTYIKMRNDHLIELQNDDISAANAAAVLNKLLQMANGRVYSDNGIFELHRHKLDALKDIIDTSDTPVLVFYNFKHDAEAIEKEIKGVERLDGAQKIKDWNDGKIKVLLAHPASCGYGLNLQSGGRVIVWYGLTWSLEQYQQANARLYRQGQEKPVIIHHLITRGTVDEQVMLALQEKDTSQAALLSALKATL